MRYDVVILGGGAAGLMCAREAGRRGRRVVVLERQERVGKKILISGGGRCNFTNLYSAPENFLSENEHFCRSPLSRFSPGDFIALVERHGIEYYEKKLGQLFCKTSAKDITGLLLKECEAAGVTLRLSCQVRSVAYEEGFSVETDNESFQADSLVVATGGLSYRHLGATDFGYRLADQFHLKVNATAPGLVPLTWGAEEKKKFGELSGVSVDTQVTCAKASFRENILFTHRGLSGPAILQVSSYWNPGDSILIDLLPDLDALRWLSETKSEGGKMELKNLLAQRLPKRFAEIWCETYAPMKPLHEIPDRVLSEIASRLHRWEVFPESTEGYDKAEVTRGGVSTDELSSKTLEAKKVPGLFFIGEVVDVTGHLGGHNFQWAWASGFAAGQSV